MNKLTQKEKEAIKNSIEEMLQHRISSYYGLSLDELANGSCDSLKKEVVKTIEEHFDELKSQGIINSDSIIKVVLLPSKENSNIFKFEIETNDPYVLEILNSNERENQECVVKLL